MDIHIDPLFPSNGQQPTNPTNPTDNNPYNQGDNIGRWGFESVTPADVKEKKKEAEDLHDKKAQEDNIATTSEWLDRTVSGYQNDPRKKKSAYEYYDWNLAMNNPRGNLNGKSFDTTQRLSRAADAFNNQVRYVPPSIGRRTNSKFGTNEFQQSRIEQWPSIETQEMRQMRANEAVDAYARNRDANRQANVEDYSLELQKARDRNVMDMEMLTGKNNEEQARIWQNIFRDTQYTSSWQQYWSQVATKFMSEYGIDVKTRLGKYCLNLGDVLGQYMSSAFGMGVSPQYVQIMMSRLASEAASNCPDQSMAPYAYNLAQTAASMYLNKQNLNSMLGSFGSWFN